MRVLITGISGYIGSVLSRQLMRSGHEVIGLDTGFYRQGLLYRDYESQLPTLEKDIRHITAADIEGVSAVIHLAELSNDPIAAYSTGTTFDINLNGTMKLAHIARAAGVNRFIYFSSCSVYGAGGDDIKTEDSTLRPQSAYATCKALCERGIHDLGDNKFAAICLRNATAYGASPHMRFDILLNNLAGYAWSTRRLQMTSDGTPWRPLVHVRDICQAVVLALQAPAEVIQGQTINVGGDEENYRVHEVAEIVAKAVSGCEMSLGPKDRDNRSYRVSFSKIRELLPKFKCSWTVERGVDELIRLFDTIGMTHKVFTARPFTRLKQLEYLLNTGQIDKHYYWTGALDEKSGDQASRDELAA